jgi:hypothetical protein
MSRIGIRFALRSGRKAEKMFTSASIDVKVLMRVLTIHFRLQ